MDLLLKRPKDDVKEEKKPELNGSESTDGEPAPPKISGDTSLVDGKRSSSSSPSRQDATNTRKQEYNAYQIERSLMDLGPTSSTPKDFLTKRKQEADQLESTRIEMGEVRQENERLKMVLAQIMKDYNALQKQFLDVVQQEETKKATSSETTIPEALTQAATAVDEEAEAELVSLSLGRSSCTTVPKKEEDASRPASASSSGVGKVDGEKKNMSKDLMLGLTAGHKRSASDSVMSASAQRQPSLSPENSFEDPKEEELGHQWPPSKVLKTMRSGDVDEVSQQISHVKKARVSVRARCDAPTMNDGCQWRKYGQKISKGNPCPRAYYRCTVAPACPVRKQVQRCAEDMSILVTTYEGTHNHPLPMAATAMASTTAAAASMLLSGTSATTRSSIGAPLVNSTVITPGGHTGATGYPGLHGLNFNITDSSRPRPSYYIPPASPLAASPSHPTITLDLTNPSPSTSVTTTFPAHLSRFDSSFASSLPRYPTSLSFSGSTDSASPSPAATSWGSGAAGSYPTYGSQLYGSGGKSSHMGGALTLGRQGIQDPLFHQSSVPFWQKNTAVASSSSAPSTNAITVASAATGSAIQSALTDTLTKAITSDPSFQTVLAAAITSIVGGGSASAEGVGKSGPSRFKWGDHLPSALSAHSAVSTSTSAPSNGGGGGGCAVSYLNREVPPATSTASATMQPKNLMFLQPSLSLSNPKSSSASPVDNREHTS